MQLKTPAAILATAVLAVGLSSVTTASAAQTTSAGQVFCVHKTTKIVRALKACNPKTERVLTIQEAQQGIASQGPRGERGLQGAQGERGLTGQQGQKGDPGRDGVDGKPGAKGDTGSAGAKGDPGKDATSIKYQTFDLKIFGIPGVKGQVTCRNVSTDPAVLEWANCTKGAPPATPSASPTPSPSWSPDGKVDQQ